MGQHFHSLEGPTFPQFVCANISTVCMSKHLDISTAWMGQHFQFVLANISTVWIGQHFHSLDGPTFLQLGWANIFTAWMGQHFHSFHKPTFSQLQYFHRMNISTAWMGQHFHSYWARWIDQGQVLYQCGGVTMYNAASLHLSNHTLLYN